MKKHPRKIKNSGFLKYLFIAFIVLITFLSPLVFSNYIDPLSNELLTSEVGTDCAIEIDDGEGLYYETEAGPTPVDPSQKTIYDNGADSLPLCDDSVNYSKLAVYLEMAIFVLPFIIGCVTILIAIHMFVNNKFTKINKRFRSLTVPILGFGNVLLMYVLYLKYGNPPQCEAGGPELGGPEGCIIGANIGGGMIFYGSIILFVSTIFAIIILSLHSVIRRRKK